MSSGLAPEMQRVHGGKWKRYPVYKDSGVEWLGVVPEGWNVRKLKHIASVKPSNVDKKTVEGEHPVRLCNYVDVYYNDYITSDLDLMKATASVVEIGKFILRKGDILITKDSESWDDIAVPAYASSDFNDVLCGYHLAQIRPDTALSDGEYLFWSFCAHDINDQFRVAATGVTRYGLGKYWIDNSLFLVPPKDEQHAIATFLDRETGRIDALLAKKERQIELLQEKRAALISHAVTDGLDPGAPMKDSGVEWLGEVPEHWIVAPLYARYQVRLGKMLDGKRITGAHLAPYLRNVNVQWGKVDVSDLPMMDFLPSERVRLSLQKGDLLVCEGGEVGRTAVWGDEIDECYYQKAIHRLRPQNETDYNRFFYYVMFMAAHIGVFAAGADISTIGHLTAEKLRKHRFVFPPKKEQHEIADYLDGTTTKITGIVESVSDSIDKLREYRTALISAAVTGKIDVRGGET